MTEDVLLFGAIAVRPAVLACLPQFEAATGLRVAAKWELNPILKKQVEAGERFDLLITNPNLIGDLVAIGRVAAGSQKPFGRIAMGIAAKAGSVSPDIGSVDAFKRVLKDAKSIAYATEGTSGAYFLGLLERLGLADELKPRLVAITGGQTAQAVSDGKAQLSVVPLTSILAASPAVMLVGAFPAELQSHIDFAVGISADTRRANAALQLSEFLTSRAVAAILTAKGVELPSSSAASART
jgi:molybdate transport system substrate-binding protein